LYDLFDVVWLWVLWVYVEVLGYVVSLGFVCDGVVVGDCRSGLCWMMLVGYFCGFVCVMLDVGYCVLL